MMTLSSLSRASSRVLAATGASLLAHPCAALAFNVPAKVPDSEELPVNLGSSSSGGSHTSTGGASIERTIVGLAIVIAVIWGLSWVLRQVKSGREPKSSSTGLASVAALTLGSGRSVHLVRAGNDYVLLAGAEHGLVPIHRYTEEQARAAGLIVTDEPAPARRTPFATLATPAIEGRDPMGVPFSGTTVVDRLREWTVRR